jgi:hypothetical protein
MEISINVEFCCFVSMIWKEVITITTVFNCFLFNDNICRFLRCIVCDILCCARTKFDQCIWMPRFRPWKVHETEKISLCLPFSRRMYFSGKRTFSRLERLGGENDVTDSVNPICTDRLLTHLACYLASV